MGTDPQVHLAFGPIRPVSCPSSCKKKITKPGVHRGGRALARQLATKGPTSTLTLHRLRRRAYMRWTWCRPTTPRSHIETEYLLLLAQRRQAGADQLDQDFHFMTRSLSSQQVPFSTSRGCTSSVTQQPGNTTTIRDRVSPSPTQGTAPTQYTTTTPAGPTTSKSSQSNTQRLEKPRQMSS